MNSIPRIFISYRRLDSSGHTGRLNDRLSARLGAHLFFMDLKTIGPGLDFVETIKEAIASTDVLIAVIGKRWLALDDTKGLRRLDDPSDSVRLEISTALARNIRIIPVLVQGASMPDKEELPHDLRKLSQINAIDISDSRWDYDVELLIKALKKELKSQGGIRTKSKVIIALAALAIILGASFYPILGQFDIDIFSKLVRLTKDQSRIDAEALNLISHYLSGTTNVNVSADRLKNSIKETSSSVREQIFYQAAKVRRENWRDPSDKPLMERTIPIFQALLEADTEGANHLYYSELGYALKDQREPQWKESEKALSKAIKIRGPWQNNMDLTIYEFNRAVCRIMLDKNFNQQKQSSKESRQSILEDLKAVSQGDPGIRDFMSQFPVRQWLSLNKLSEKAFE